MSFFSESQQQTIEQLKTTANHLMTNVPPKFGDCVTLSCLWHRVYSVDYDVVPRVVCGDLIVNGEPAFVLKEPIPMPGADQALIIDAWDGHAWLEIDGLIGDLSLFRTAAALSDDHPIRTSLEGHYGTGKGMMLFSKE